MPNVRKLVKDANTGVVKLLNDSTTTIPASLLTSGSTEAEWKPTAATPTLGVSSVYGTAVVKSPDTGFYQIEPIQIVATWGGTFSTENANIKVVATYNDATTATFTAATVNATGTQTFNVNDFGAAITTAKNIVSIAISATTDKATSTLVTVSVQVTGLQSQ